MNKLIAAVLCAAVLCGWTAALPAQDSVSEAKKAQNKLLAYRAARADGIRKLAERIKGLQITSETTVKDFVTENDQIQTALFTYLSGMEETSKPQYADDGACTVKMKITLAEVITDLKKIHNACYKGGKYKVEDFEKMTVTNTVKEIEETGMGAPRPDKPEYETTVVKEGDSFETVGRIPPYWKEHCNAQGRLLALRAARVDGMRRLAERIKGTMIQSNTVVKDFVTEADFINMAMKTFLVGAKEVGVRYHPDELIVEVDMQVKLRTVYANIESYVEEKYKGDSAKIKSFQEITTRAEDTLIKETGMGVPRVGFTGVDAPPALPEMPGWAGETIRMTGNAAVDASMDNKAQAKLMAFRGAELDARRKIAEKLNGLVIEGKTTVQDFITQSDDIRTQMLAYQQGAHVVDGSQKLADDGTATVTVEIELRPLWDRVVEWRKSVKIKSGPGGTEIKTKESIRTE